MRRIKNLRPFVTLHDASNILSGICRELQLPETSLVPDFLADAMYGDINLTVVLPSDFQVAKKNLETYSDTPFRPKFPAGTAHCFIERKTAFALSLSQQAMLDTVFTISNDGTKDIYHSVKPCMSISTADLRVSSGQLMQYMETLYSSKNESSSDKASGTAIVEIESTAIDVESEGINSGSCKATNIWNERSIKQLLDERNLGMTQQSLAEKYGVTRQRIAVLLKKHKVQYSPRKASPFDQLKGFKSKK